MVKIIKVDVLKNNHLRLTFSDGCSRVIDFKPYIKNVPLTKPLSDPAFFKQVKIYENGRGIYWPNGYDFCPDYLRHHAADVSKTAETNQEQHA